MRFLRAQLQRASMTFGNRADVLAILSLVLRLRLTKAYESSTGVIRFCFRVIFSFCSAIPVPIGNSDCGGNSFGCEDRSSPQCDCGAVRCVALRESESTRA